MTTWFYDDRFRQVVGGTTFLNTGQPTARTSALIPDDPTTFNSDPWRIWADGQFLLEIDSTNRGGGVLASGAPVLQRSTLPQAYQFPAGVGVVWNAVPAAEIAPAVFAAIAAQNIQALAILGRAGYVYRLSVPSITNAGDLWVGVNVPNRFTD